MAICPRPQGTSHLLLSGCNPQLLMSALVSLISLLSSPTREMWQRPFESFFFFRWMLIEHYIKLCPFNRCPLEQNLLFRMDISSNGQFLNADLDIVQPDAHSTLIWTSIKNQNTPLTTKQKLLTKCANDPAAEHCLMVHAVTDLAPAHYRMKNAVPMT